MSCRLALLLALVAVAGAAPAAAARAGAACSQGDSPCWCRAAGGTWETPPSPLLPTCKVYITHQGRQRSANVYLPPNFRPEGWRPMWIQLHGVFWNSMGDINKQVGGWNVQAADATALWDKLVGGKAQTEGGAIIVYPQSLGDPASRQFFQNGYWSCSVGVCMDKGIDDIGFVEEIVRQLPGRFGADQKRIYLSGKSAGGILVHAALCKSAVIAQKVRVAVDILGGLPEPMAEACAPQGKTTLLLVHGEKDEHLPFNRRVVLDWVPFYSKQGAADFWRRKYGLEDHTAKKFDGGEYECDYYTSKGVDQKVVLCGIRDAGHTTDIPYVGAPFDLAWSFLEGYRR